MVNQMSAKVRKKWNRRILIAKTLRIITLTRVKLNNDDLWVCTNDLQDFYSLNAPLAYQMTPNELVNRFSHIAAQPFIEQQYIDQSSPGSTLRRVRRLYYKINDIEALNEYIVLCTNTKNAL
jgi:hypothetical protein